MSAVRTPGTGVRGRLGSAPALLVTCVVVVAVCLTWAFLAMRDVMGVGGSCADGGPYVSAQSCPSGTWLIAIAVPLLVIAAMAGSAAAVSLEAPDLLIPMWGVLFGSLGWNFLEYAVTGPGVVWGWLVCGVVFELMALPALVGILRGVRDAVLPPAGTTHPRARWWVPAYAALGAVGFTLGWLSYAVAS